MIKEAHFISFSPCGGTENVNQALRQGVSLPAREHNITLPQNRAQSRTFGRDDLVFLAFPVYGGHMPRFFAEFIAGLSGSDTPIAFVAVYGNRAYEGAFLDMDKALRPQGFRPIAAIAAIAEHSTVPTAATGRPDAEDADKLAEFARQTVAKAQAGGEAVAMPGEYPAWSLPPGALPLFPKTDADACTACGVCAAACPNSAIPADSPCDTDLAKCLVCAACIKYCPEKARSMGLSSPEVMQEMAKHRANMLMRKEPELFV